MLLLGKENKSNHSLGMCPGCVMCNFRNSYSDSFTVGFPNYVNVIHYRFTDSCSDTGTLGKESESRMRLCEKAVNVRKINWLWPSRRKY